MNKVGNYKYNGNIPAMGGDIFRGQDMIRDHWFLQDRIGKVLKDLGEEIPIIISGGIVSKGAGDTLNITPCIGYHKIQVEVPDSWEASPPSKMNADVDAIRVESIQQTNMAISSATLNGSTTNYVKLKFALTNGNTRQRAIKQNSYNYELVPSFSFVVDSVAPTEYEICLTTFVGSTGGSFIFTDYGTKRRPLFSTDETFASNSDLKYPSEKAVKSIINKTNTNLILHSLRHIETLGMLSTACQDNIAQGGDYLICGGGTSGQYWRSYKGQLPKSLNSGSSGNFDQHGQAIYRGDNKWYFAFRNAGLYTCDNMSASTPTFTLVNAGSFNYTHLHIDIENGKEVLYCLDSTNKQVVKFTNNGTNKTILFTSANSPTKMFKHENTIILTSSYGVEYSLNNGISFNTGSITLTGSHALTSDMPIVYFKNYFFMCSLYNATAPKIYRSSNGNVWNVVYTGDTTTYSSNVYLIAVNDEVLLWMETYASGGFRIMHSFMDDLSVVEPPILVSMGTNYPVQMGFFKNSLFFLGNGNTPTILRTPMLVY